MISSYISKENVFVDFKHDFWELLMKIWSYHPMHHCHKEREIRNQTQDSRELQLKLKLNVITQCIITYVLVQQLKLILVQTQWHPNYTHIHWPSQEEE